MPRQKYSDSIRAYKKSVILEVFSRLGYDPQSDLSIREWCRERHKTGKLPGAPPREDTFPKHKGVLIVLADRFAASGFSYRIVEGSERIDFQNYPTLAGQQPSLLELLYIPLDIIDGCESREHLSRMRQEPSDSISLAPRLQPTHTVRDSGMVTGWDSGGY
jgi:hypothetical protein